MGCSRYIGRVGALAVFLGVGVSLTTGQAIAYAEPSATDTSHATQAATPGRPAPHTPTSETAARADTTPASTPDGSVPSPHKPKRQPKNKGADSKNTETAGKHRDANSTRHADRAT